MEMRKTILHRLGASWVQCVFCACSERLSVMKTECRAKAKEAHTKSIKWILCSIATRTPIEGANADAVLKVLDRAPAWVLIPQIVQLVPSARAEQGRAEPSERVGIRQPIIDDAGPFD